MPAKGHVSLTRQTIYCFIPIMDLYAAYNVKKLRWYLLIMLGVSAVLTVGAELIYPQESRYDESMFLENKEIDWAYIMLGENPELTIISIIIHNAVAYSIAVYLIRKWSNRWNQNFTESL
jgi:hypothetical protein